MNLIPLSVSFEYPSHSLLQGVIKYSNKFTLYEFLFYFNLKIPLPYPFRVSPLVYCISVWGGVPHHKVK